jgi:ABC-type glycerol-3-phosphate transport system substrate-binding protein
MRMWTGVIVASAALVAGIGQAAASCGIEKGSVRVLSNDFPALHAVVGEAEKCATATVTVRKNQTKDHEQIAVPALKANPAEYTSQIVANSSILPLLNDGLIRPLDAYVAKFGQGLQRSQLITINNQVMAVAFMANSQHLFYREDILKQAGVGVPTTYDEVLAAAKAIKDKNLMPYPLGATARAGWNLAQEFVNMYMGTGAPFYKEGTAEAAIANANGIKALETMKAMAAFMNPDYLTFDSNALQAEFRAGKVAIANFWGSRAAAVLDPKDGAGDIVKNIKFARAPTFAGGTAPASTLWWDGFTVAKNITDDDAEATFRALVHGSSPAMMAANADKAVWLIAGFQPGPNATGVAANVSAGTRPYPMVPQMGLLHTALGAGIADFMQGKKDAMKTLQDVEAAYAATAKQAGFLK